MLEAKVMIALVARYVDLVKVSWHLLVTIHLPRSLITAFKQVGIGKLSVDKTGKPILNDKGHYKVAEEMYPVYLSSQVHTCIA